METLTLHSNYSIQRTILAPGRAQPLGSGAQKLSRPYARVTYQFTLQDRQRIQADAESLYAFAQRHQGDAPFWWDGGAWGTLGTPVLVGEGDGVRTRFWLPNRNLLATSTVYVNAALASPQPTNDLVLGSITFVAPVALNAVVTAQYTCKYRLLFWFEGDAALTAEYFYKSLFSFPGIVLRETLSEGS